MRPHDAEPALRLVRSGDGTELGRAYSRNRGHLAPWEPLRNEEFFSAEWQEDDAGRCVDEAAVGRSRRWVIEAPSGEIIGRVNLNNIVRGAFWSADLGYWVDANHGGEGLASRSVAAVLQIAHDEIGLHRVQAATLEHNLGSQRVLEKNGFEAIGRAPGYLRIAGEWQDHLLFQRLLE